jgi:hypothetical protein
MKVAAALSMIHERADRNSATRRFRGEPVLQWTLARLRQVESLSGICLMCWDDQVEAATPPAVQLEAELLVKTPRVSMPSIESIAAARRWSDGWRGGLLQTCDFDLGFHARWLLEVLERFNVDALLVVDPSAGLIDPQILRDVIAHAEGQAAVELCFTQAAPGLGGVLVKESILKRLAAVHTNPGKLLHYLPDQPTRDPIAGEACAAIPTRVARTLRRFKLDSDRQIETISRATLPLNGQLIRSSAEELVGRVESTAVLDAAPREVRLELTTRRAGRPIFSPSVEREDMSVDLALTLIEQISTIDDVRLTLAGVGDPLLHPQAFDILAAARARGVEAVSIETDLVELSGNAIARLVDAAPDVVAVHLPAMTPQTYAAIMGRDGFAEALENLKLLIENRQSRHRGVPIVVPLFVKCRQNLGEMELWYDQWLRILGSAVIDGPSTFGGLIDDVGVADMSPPTRSACRRLSSRMTILSDGRVASCEEDVLGRQPAGDARVEPIRDIWQRGMNALRQSHACGRWSDNPVCAACRQWHRP